MVTKRLLLAVVLLTQTLGDNLPLMSAERSRYNQRGHIEPKREYHALI
ncbi:MAG: hypothetical protein KME25_25705 [Symplocastrum torsivum CPER-KK1]|uniref:Uncharacterized protein n=1 Tax=Symplocastrum torsivum CPER-KK1 TaxID=450513 RepID=A0A951UCD0_9CYAN|nr:hypothetical protein [Symplocastrum torsivum CPER-KK1]